MEARQLQAMIAAEQPGSVIVIGGPGSGKTHLLRHCTANLDNVILIDGLLSNDFASNLSLLYRRFRVPIANGTEMLTFEELSDALISRHHHHSLPHTVIVIDALERFVAGEHFGSGQQLLYGLLELSASLPILVVGLTRRIDIVEGMEKRVRSRFSQNVVHLGYSGDCGDTDTGYTDTGDKRKSTLEREHFATSIATKVSDLSVPELLALTSVIRVQHRGGKLTIATILNEYTTSIRHETDSSLMLTAGNGSQVSAGERQMARAVESLCHRNILRHARNDHWQHRQYRLLCCTIPTFAIPEYLLSAPNCPVPLRSMIMSIATSV